MAGNRKLTVAIDIKADASSAVRETKKLDKATDDLDDSFGDLRGAITPATAAIATLTASFVKSITEVSEYQRQVARLENALSRVPGATAGAVDSLIRQAEVLSTITGATDTAILSTQALIAQLGVAPGQLEKATQASVDLAAALGISLEAAARNVGRTVGGFAGELGELVPELKDISAEALRAGEGIEFLAERFAGAAEESRTTLEAVKNLGNALSDFGRDATAAATDGKTLGNVFDFIATGVANLGSVFAKQPDQIKLFVQALKLGNLEVENGLELATEYVAALRGTTAANVDLAPTINTLAQQYGSYVTALQKVIESEERAARLRAASEASLKSFSEEAKKLGFTLERELLTQLEELEVKQIAFDRALRDGTITQRDYQKALEALAKEENELRIKLGERTEALQDNKRATDDQVDANERLRESEARLRGEVAGTTEELARRVDIFSESGQRVGSRLTSPIGAPLFPGLSGAAYTYTVRRSVPNTIGGVRFF